MMNMIDVENIQKNFHQHDLNGLELIFKKNSLLINEYIRRLDDGRSRSSSSEEEKINKSNFLLQKN
jgi:hypothetical protein